MLLTRVEQAVYNNAHWCDTISNLHGAPGEFSRTHWSNHSRVPQYYPNFITLSAQANVHAYQPAIYALSEADLPGGWGLKDSFCSLDIATQGFQLLFEASWIWRDPNQSIPEQMLADLRWDWVQHAAELAQWEAAWNGNPIMDSTTLQPRLFLPTLLADPAIGFIVAYDNQTIAAGAIAYLANDVVSLSNVFGESDDPVALWAGFVALTQVRFPGAPIVGYEHGSDLTHAQAVSFESLHPLRVWLFR